MARISAVLVLVGACAGMAAAASAAAPPYVESIQDLQLFDETTMVHLLSMDGTLPAMTDYRRHYIVIIAHLGEFSKWLAGTCLVEYEKDYVTQLSTSIPLGFMNPQYIVDQLKYYQSTLKRLTEKLTRLINSGCTEQQPASSCNVVIHSHVVADPKRYKKEAELLLLLGEMASLFLKESGAMINASKDFLSVPYLVNNAKNLRELIFAGDNVIKMMNKNIC